MKSPGICVATIVVVTAACQAVKGSRDGLTATEALQLKTVPALPVRVALLLDGSAHENRGTAFPIAPGTFLTAKHVLVPGITRVVLGTEEVDIERLGEGASTSLEDDWVKFRVISPSAVAATEPIAVHAGEITPGMQLYLVGCWKHEQVFGLPVTAVAPPEWLGDEHAARAFVFVRAPHAEVYEGVSGGPLVYWNEQAKRFEAVGLYRGTRCRDFGIFTIDSVHDVRRLP